MKEITFELTDYCPNHCQYCSSNNINDYVHVKYLSLLVIDNFVKSEHYDRIHLSGGEPLSHPQFYNILQLCKKHADDVVVHTNALNHIAYNQSVLDGIYLECYVTVPENVKMVRVVKRIEQGKEKTRPEVHFSKNWTQDCHCDHHIIKPDGTIVQSPCCKEEKIEIKKVNQ